MPHAAVNQHRIGQAHRFAIGCCARHFAVTPSQNFAHGGIIIARLCRADIVSAVLVRLHGKIIVHHAGRNGRLALRVADIETFQTAQFVGGQTDEFRQLFHALGLPAVLQLVLCQRVFRILHRHVQPHFSLALFGFWKLHGTRMFAVQSSLQCFGQREIAQQNIRFGFAQIMLCHKGFCIILRVRLRVVARVGEETFVAHVAAAANAHPMQAHAAARFSHRHNVDILRLVQVFAVDELFGLHGAQCLNLVAPFSGRFKIQRFGSLQHFLFQILHQMRGFAVQKCHRMADLFAVFFGRHRTHARRGAAVDLREQARAVAVGEHAVFAGAQPKHFLQDFNAVAHRIAVGIGAEILVRLFGRAAKIGQLRKFVPAHH